MKDSVNWWILNPFENKEMNSRMKFSVTMLQCDSVTFSYIYIGISGILDEASKYKNSIKMINMIIRKLL